VRDDGIPDNVKVSFAEGKNPSLCLIVQPGGAHCDALSLKTVNSLLEQNGARDWFVDQEQIRLLREEQTTLAAPKSYRIAELRDAQVQVRISGDRNEARITILPPFGGMPASREMIGTALKDAGVTFGIYEKKIEDLVAQGACEDTLIAMASPAMPGTEVRFERLIEESDHKGQPKVGEDGKVDLHDLGLFISVVKGTPLLRRLPPTPGIPGICVDGSLLPSKKPRDQNLHSGTGTAISSEDPNLLIAAADGLPIFEDNSVKIINRLDLDGIDYETGNVEFIGSLHIRGSIQSGFNAKAGGNIVVVDTVDASDLTAGGSIQLRCGVFGRGRSHINARGDIKARFLNDCTIYCGGNLEVDDLIANCTIICEGMNEAGQRWGKGQIYGGRILATKGIRAKILGSVMEMNTMIEVSPSPMLASREGKVLDEIESLEQKSADIGRSVAYLQCSGPRENDARMDRLNREYQELRGKIESLRLELKELSAKLQVRSDARITSSQVFPGVTVSIGRKKEFITSPLEFFVFDPAAEWDLPVIARK
jgi:uncharacterized protein (DUF342 family)